MLSRLIRVIFVIVTLLAVATHAAAQGDGNQQPGEATIHVVQPGETLFRIAMQYGTTVEAIETANGITDPRYLAVGQRLLIPNVQSSTPGAIIQYTVQPGDTLQTLIHTHHTTSESLASANRITNPALLYVGQNLVINAGAADPTLAEPSMLHVVQPGETIYDLALVYHLPVSQLRDILPSVLFPGQRIWLPGSGSDIKDLPAPILNCTISPTPAFQGGTVEVHIITARPALLSGTFMNYPLRSATPDGFNHYILFGVHVFTVPGVYPLVLIAAEPDGTQTEFDVRLWIDSGGYGSENITVTDPALLTPEVNEPEWDRIATIMSGFNQQRYFDGLMGLPSSGALTSVFGTARSYNGGVLTTFHSGTDFGSTPGSPIYAPAAGVVVLSENMPVRGNATIIDHGWGVYTGYWHQTESYVTTGMTVSPGQIIGTVGSTGRVTGPHLHWEMWVGGTQVDPMQWVQQPFP